MKYEELDKYDQWNFFYLDLAHSYAAKSKDPSTKTGCVIVNSDNIPVGFGYNGLAAKHSEEYENMILNDRPEKYKRVIHAELNAIFNSNSSLKGSTAYITHFPCLACCNILSQSGISKVVVPLPEDAFNERWNFAASMKELQLLDIEVSIIHAESMEDIFNQLRERRQI